MGYYGNRGLNFAWDLGILNFRIFIFRIFFFNLGLKGVMEKCVRCFLVYLFLRGTGVSIKKCKKNVLV